MRIYISGAITGTDDYIERFKAAEHNLKQELSGVEVVNPAAVNAMLPTDSTYEEYMEMSINLLKMCDAIYMLKGWEASRGANREYGYAVGSRKVVIYE